VLFVFIVEGNLRKRKNQFKRGKICYFLYISYRFYKLSLLKKKPSLIY